MRGKSNQSAALEEEVDSLSNVRLMVRATIYLRNSECDCIRAFSSSSSLGTSESFAVTALSQMSLIRSSRGSNSTIYKGRFTNAVGQYKERCSKARVAPQRANFTCPAIVSAGSLVTKPVTFDIPRSGHSEMALFASYFRESE